jgi:hypothetical protein
VDPERLCVCAAQSSSADELLASSVMRTSASRRSRYDLLRSTDGPPQMCRALRIKVPACQLCGLQLSLETLYTTPRRPVIEVSNASDV